MSKPNTVFNLGLRDIDLIEDAINTVIARLVNHEYAR